MISDPNGIEPLLDSVKLRELADCLNGGSPIDALAQRWSFPSTQDLLATSARSMQLEWLASDDMELTGDALDGCPAKLIHRHSVFPLQRGEGWLRLAVSNPFDFAAIDSVASALQVEVRPVMASAETIQPVVGVVL